MQYHLGWLDQQFQPVDGHPGKLLRPTLLLLSYELACTWEQSAAATSPAFSLRPALPAAASLALARLHLWKVLEEGVEPATALDLAKLFDMTLLKLTEGQYLDLSFEQQSQVSLSSYEAMIGRKTACLMCCATQMGARLATCNQEIISGLARFGYTLGLAFQI